MLKSIGIIDENGGLNEDELELYETLLVFSRPGRVMGTSIPTQTEIQETLKAIRDPANAICIRNKVAALAMRCGEQARSAEPDEEQ